jgi:eukaryotic-like serine/threonine-protein kinase
VLRAHTSIVRHCTGEQGGYEVKSQGDGFMIAYPSARRGLKWAVDMQRWRASTTPSSTKACGCGSASIPARRSVRETTSTRGVTLTARLRDRAGGGEILTSSVVRELVGGSATLASEDAGELPLKGLRGSQRVYRVVWEQPEGARANLRAVG